MTEAAWCKMLRSSDDIAWYSAGSWEERRECSDKAMCMPLPTIFSFCQGPSSTSTPLTLPHIQGNGIFFPFFSQKATRTFFWFYYNHPPPDLTMPGIKMTRVITKVTSTPVTVYPFFLFSSFLSLDVAMKYFPTRRKRKELREKKNSSGSFP